MTIKEALSFIPRKIITASLTGTLIAVLLGLISPDPFSEELHTYLEGFYIWTPIYFFYSFPVILIYGTITSTLSDYLAGKLSKKKHGKSEFFYSALLHLLFGLILLWISIIASAIFFIIDRIIGKAKRYSLLKGFSSLTIPLLFFILFTLVQRFYFS